MTPSTCRSGTTAGGRLRTRPVRGVPVAELEVRARVLRPGRSVELVEAALSVAARDVVRAQAWRILRTTQEVASRQLPAPPLPAESTPIHAPG